MNYQEIFSSMSNLLVSEGGSDIHLAVNKHPMIRVNTVLRELVEFPQLSAEDTLGFAELLMEESQFAEFMERKDLDFAYSLPEVARFRCNALFESGGVALALRRIPNVIPTLEELRLPVILSDIAKQKQGFFLVVGPVGQGKSTTLASMIDHINERRVENILTVEDPVEYLFTDKKSVISQRQVGFDTESFATALKGMFRQDVNVALIGEMRDTETISAAVTAAETGHLVLSTLHTNSASQTIHRIIDSFPAYQQGQIRMQLASSLTAIFSQRLLPRIDGGMIPAYEILINNNAVSNLIRENRVHEIQSVIETSMDLGMVDMNRSLATLVHQGEVTIEHAQKYSLDPQALLEII